MTFSEIDLGRIIGGEWELVCGRWLVADTVGQWLTRKPDGLYLTDPESAETIWVHPGKDGLVLPFPFSAEQFKSFCDWHPTFEWEAITSVFTNDDGFVDTDALAALDKRGADAGILIRCALGIAECLPDATQNGLANAARAEESPSPAPDSTVPVVQAAQAVSQQVGIKKSVLITKHQSTWKTIERDLQDANQNGLANAAKAPQHGFWLEDAALAWAVARGKLTKAVDQKVPATPFSGLTHKIRH